MSDDIKDVKISEKYLFVATEKGINVYICESWMLVTTIKTKIHKISNNKSSKTKVKKSTLNNNFESSIFIHPSKTMVGCLLNIPTSSGAQNAYINMYSLLDAKIIAQSDLGKDCVGVEWHNENNKVYMILYKKSIRILSLDNNLSKTNNSLDTKIKIYDTIDNITSAKFVSIAKNQLQHTGLVIVYGTQKGTLCSVQILDETETKQLICIKGAHDARVRTMQTAVIKNKVDTEVIEHVLVTGDSQGTVKVWDTKTLIVINEDEERKPKCTYETKCRITSMTVLGN